MILSIWERFIRLSSSSVKGVVAVLCGDTEAIDSPDTGTTSRTFDAAGNLLTETDARGKTTTHQYDALNRLIQTTLDDGGQITYTYDTGTNNRGRLMSITDPNGSTSWSYDSQGRVTGRHQQLDGVQLTLGYHYNAEGRLTQFTYPSGKTVTLGYDAGGRIDSVAADSQAIVDTISYHPFSQPTGWNWGNGSPHTRTLDLDGRISSFPLGAVAHSITYDSASRITGITGTPAKSYGYDPLARLMSYAAPTIAQSYGYDPNGNRLTDILGSQTTIYQYGPASNRLQSRTQGTTQNYTYDPAGNLTDDGAHVFTYDDRGRMVQATTGALTTATAFAHPPDSDRTTAGGLSKWSPPISARCFRFATSGSDSISPNGCRFTSASGTNRRKESALPVYNPTW